MIITRLKAGLGNQMFQYALGRRLSVDGDDDLKFDLSWFDDIQINETRRVLEIDKFNVVLPKATRAETEDLQSGYLFQVKEFMDRVRGRLDRNFFYRFDPKILKKKNNVFLNGYFQAHEYFDSIRSILLKDFTIKSWSSDGMEIRGQVEKARNPVALHIRRGDFVTTCKHWNGLCDINYYQAGLSQIKKRDSDAQLFIFSDDIKWAQENLMFEEQMIFVSRSGLCSAEEIALMSLCKHQIIANSTFSWWGAWLNQNEQKIVVAPSRWLIIANIDTHDLLPNEWIKI
ncbi:MAG: alpha-1,2-fucosyltransferase [Patescibacteria group bacterium]